ncbi:MAG: helix-turn-helix domain-containing protein [Richelia sp. RM2_1_2]|nr:helix-turn-helix domain-containing protein [Richelia sp. SM2_1_7]NJM22555.1 helix-turn-helix domain-containing protein [Richelia sp. SM1_7_0]NJN10757.1 helix-turn-helix domain-containing protein [Richelia sp. RM1_1_1]NJO26125.1 helix-turn-helix domain-containing protein [Richelia sp. SL_2_1]NJO58837.1 helix-turn-helix domain-containing protein [Richelia sp. RM2_1_2]
MIGTTKAAKLLNISPRRLRYLIAKNRVYGAYKIGKTWVMPVVDGLPKIKTASHGPNSTWNKVKTPAQSFVHINRQLIGKELDNGEFAPVISVKCRNQNTYSSRVVIPGPCTIIYEYENPQTKCGARVWIETYSEPMPANGCTYEEIIAKITEKTQTKSQKSPNKSDSKGFAKKSHRVPA